MEKMKPTIPSFRTIFRKEEITYILKHTKQVLNSGRLTLGKYTEVFEKTFADLTGVKYATAVNSGTSALEIIFKILRVNNMNVLIPTNTNFATAISAINAGAIIRMYDSDLYPDFDDIRRKITENTKVVVVVHIGGYITQEIQDIKRYCKARNVHLVEDASHAHGAIKFEKKAGSFGDAGAFSFFPTKVITTGEGGIITTNSKRIHTLAMQYRDQGKNVKGSHAYHGNSWRLSEIHAVIGLSQMNTLMDDNVYRHRIMEMYREKLLLCHDITFPDIPSDHLPSGYKCVAFVPSKKVKCLMNEFLRSRGIFLGKGIYDIPLHKQPFFKNMNSWNYIKADNFSNTHICLPIWRTITENDVDRVVSTMKSCFNLYKRHDIK